MSGVATPRIDNGPIYNSLRSLYRFLAYRVLFDTILCPYGLLRHAALLRSGNRSKHHTYTCFLRAPAQLEALTGPVVEFLSGTSPESSSLTILVFACSNGAEAYTVASALLRAHPGLDFHIIASDLDQRLIDAGIAGTYDREEVFHSPFVTDDFVRTTFDRAGDAYVVKPAVRSRVQFRQADVLDDSLRSRFEPADIVLAQNLFFHLAPDEARVAFRNISLLLKPRAALLIEGFDLGLREELTRARHLVPLEYRLREIYEQSRVHASLAWWRLYYGAEPYMRTRQHRTHRYGTVFLTDAGGRAR